MHYLKLNLLLGILFCSCSAQATQQKLLIQVDSHSDDVINKPLKPRKNLSFTYAYARESTKEDSLHLDPPPPFETNSLNDTHVENVNDSTHKRDKMKLKRRKRIKRKRLRNQSKRNDSNSTKYSLFEHTSGGNYTGHTRLKRHQRIKRERSSRLLNHTFSPKNHRGNYTNPKRYRMKSQKYKPTDNLNSTPFTNFETIKQNKSPSKYIKGTRENHAISSGSGRRKLKNVSSDVTRASLIETLYNIQSLARSEDLESLLRAESGTMDEDDIVDEELAVRAFLLQLTKRSDSRSSSDSRSKGKGKGRSSSSSRSKGKGKKNKKRGKGKGRSSRSRSSSRSRKRKKGSNRSSRSRESKDIESFLDEDSDLSDEFITFLSEYYRTDTTVYNSVNEDDEFEQLIDMYYQFKEGKDEGSIVAKKDNEDDEFEQLIDMYYQFKEGKDEGSIAAKKDNENMVDDYYNEPLDPFMDDYYIESDPILDRPSWDDYYDNSEGDYRDPNSLPTSLPPSSTPKDNKISGDDDLGPATAPSIATGNKQQGKKKMDEDAPAPAPQVKKKKKDEANALFDDDFAEAEAKTNKTPSQSTKKQQKKKSKKNPKKMRYV